VRRRNRLLAASLMSAWVTLAGAPVEAQEADGPRTQDAHGRALALLIADDEGGALSYLRAVDAVDPLRDPAAILLYGTLLRQAGELGRAIDVFERALQQGGAGSGAALWNEVAVTYSWSGDLDRAESSYRAALERDPTFRPAKAGLARILRWTGDSLEAERLYRALLLEEPGSVEAMVGMGFVALEALRGEAANAWFRQALSLDPLNEEALQGLSRMHEARRLSVDVTMTRLGGADGSGGSARWAGSSSYRITPRNTLIGSLDLAPRTEELVGSDPNGNGTPTFDWTASLGWGHRLSPRWNAAITFKRLASAAGAGYFATAESGRWLGSKWSVGAGFRGGHVPTTGRDFMGWVGLSRVDSERRSAGVTLFQGSDLRGTWSRSVAVSASSALGDRLTVRLGAAKGWTSSVGFYEAGFGGRLALGEGRELRAELFRFAGAFVRSGVRVGAKLGL